MKTTDNKIYVFLFSLFLSLGTGALILKIPSCSEVVTSKGNINLLTYGITVVLFCIAWQADPAGKVYRVCCEL